VKVERTCVEAGKSRYDDRTALRLRRRRWTLGSRRLTGRALNLAGPHCRLARSGDSCRSSPQGFAILNTSALTVQANPVRSSLVLVGSRLSQADLARSRNAGGARRREGRILFRKPAPLGPRPSHDGTTVSLRRLSRIHGLLHRIRPSRRRDDWLRNTKLVTRGDGELWHVRSETVDPR
jgi:hypothetical protein